MIKTERFEQVEVQSAEELREWLENNHKQRESVWLVTYKKHIQEKYLSRSDVLDELLCYGWIDGIRRKLDKDKTMQLISPRKAQHWAQSYKDRVNRLMESGRMHPAGFKSISISKEKGLWNFMDDVDALIKPDDLVAALAEYPKANAYFNAFPESSQRFILRWIKLAKKAETRANRIRKTAELAAVNKRIPGS